MVWELEAQGVKLLRKPENLEDATKFSYGGMRRDVVLPFTPPSLILCYFHGKEISPPKWSSSSPPWEGTRLCGKFIKRRDANGHILLGHDLHLAQRRMWRLGRSSKGKHVPWSTIIWALSRSGTCPRLGLPRSCGRFWKTLTWGSYKRLVHGLLYLNLLVMCGILQGGRDRPLWKADGRYRGR